MSQANRLSLNQTNRQSTWSKLTTPRSRSVICSIDLDEEALESIPCDEAKDEQTSPLELQTTLERQTLPPIENSDEDHYKDQSESKSLDNGKHLATMVGIEGAVRLLKEDRDSDFWDVTRNIATNIYLPFHNTKSEQLRLCYGNHLASLEGGRELTWFLAGLMEIEDKTERIWQAIHVVQNTCWDYSDVSMMLCKQFGKCGLVNLLLGNLEKYGLNKYNTTDERQLVISTLNILHNCAKTAKNLRVFNDLSATDKLIRFVTSNDKEYSTLALLTLSYIVPDTEVHILDTTNEIMRYIFGILWSAAANPNLKGKSMEGNFSAVEILYGLINLSRNDNNMFSLVRLDITTILLKIMERERAAEQTCALELLRVLLKLKENREKLVTSEGIINMVNLLCKSDFPGVKKAAENTIMEIMKPSADTHSIGECKKTRVRRRILNEEEHYARHQSSWLLESQQLSKSMGNPVKHTYENMLCVTTAEQHRGAETRDTDDDDTDEESYEEVSDDPCLRLRLNEEAVAKNDDPYLRMRLNEPAVVKNDDPYLRMRLNEEAVAKNDDPYLRMRLNEEAVVKNDDPYLRMRLNEEAVVKNDDPHLRMRLNEEAVKNDDPYLRMRLNDDPYLKMKLNDDPYLKMKLN